MKNVEHKWTVQDIPSQAGRLALVTGATSGIGFYTAKELARKRATVIMPARDMRKAKEAAERIEAEVPKAQLYLAKLDLADFNSVREFGEHIRQRYGTGSLDLLVNNAGIMALPKQTMNSQGLELQRLGIADALAQSQPQESTTLSNWPNTAEGQRVRVPSYRGSAPLVANIYSTRARKLGWPRRAAGTSELKNRLKIC
jgi:NAD(P)-dependent dehydrogenase (short-subunit alcohol dehydrogenase family)